MLICAQNAHNLHHSKKGDVLCFQVLLSFVPTLLHFFYFPAFPTRRDRSACPCPAARAGARLRQCVHEMTIIVGYHKPATLSSGKCKKSERSVPMDPAPSRASTWSVAGIYGAGGTCRGSACMRSWRCRPPLDISPCLEASRQLHLDICAGRGRRHKQRCRRYPGQSPFKGWWTYLEPFHLKAPPADLHQYSNCLRFG